MIEIKEGALFISDAHDNEKRKHFHHFLEKLNDGTIQTPQLFLMGDMFDLLVSHVNYTTSLFKESINLLNTLSQKIEIIYFEGNHDFALSALFPHIHVIPYLQQPTLCNFQGKQLLLSHGDRYQNMGYRLYTAIIRNSMVLKCLNFIDTKTDFTISKRILTPQLTKEICYKIPNFEQIVKHSTKKYDIGLINIDFVCEGHHHQNTKLVFDTFQYINFSSFACELSYYQIHFAEEIIFRELFVRG